MKRTLVRLAIVVVAAVIVVYGGILLWTKVINEPEEKLSTDDLAAVVSDSVAVTDSTVADGTAEGADGGKGGCPPGAVEALVERARTAGLDVRGLMTVGPTVGGPAAARPGFRVVRTLVDRLGLAECSMGMTDDLEVAVEEGSTEVRVGSALFGERPRPAEPVR